MRRILVWIVIIISSWVFLSLWRVGVFKTVQPHFSGSCRQIPLTGGAEDITIDPLTGIAYLSVTDRWSWRADLPPRGRIYAYDLNQSDAQLQNITPPASQHFASDADETFAPHGIAFYRDPDSGRQRLFAVNHPGTASSFVHQIEVYDILPSGLDHVQTISDPAIDAPNDLVATGLNSFYVTNDHGYPNGIMRTLEETLRLPFSNVQHVEQGKVRQVADDIRYANGITLSADGNTLYVSGVNDFGVHVYARDPLTNALTHKHLIKLETSADNLELDAQGNLWTGAHPKQLDFLAHGKDPANKAPSQVLRVRPDGSGFSEILLDDGSQLSGSSVAAVYQGRLLVGGVYDRRFLDCTFQ